MEYHLNFNFVWKYADKLWWGLALSVQLAFVSILIGCVIGLALALAHSGGNRWTRGAVAAYVEFVRNVPLLLLVYLVFYGIPSAGGFAYDATTSFVATLAIYSGAYLVEVFRAGLDAVPRGVIDAGKAIGLTFAQRLAWVVFPQALRRFLPPWVNSVTDTVKGSSLVSLVGIVDLMLAAQQVIGRTYEPLPVYVLAALMYFAINYALSVASRRLEARFAYIRE